MPIFASKMTFFHVNAYKFFLPPFISRRACFCGYGRAAPLFLSGRTINALGDIGSGSWVKRAGTGAGVCYQIARSASDRIYIL